MDRETFFFSLIYTKWHYLFVRHNSSPLALVSSFRKKRIGASLVAQWLRILLPMQGTWVGTLVREDPTGLGATKPVRHNY